MSITTSAFEDVLASYQTLFLLVGPLVAFVSITAHRVTLSRRKNFKDTLDLTLMEVSAPLVPKRHQGLLSLTIQAHTVGECPLDLLILFVIADCAIEIEHCHIIDGFILLFEP